MQLEEEKAWFQRSPQIHWQCQTGALWMGTGWVWTAKATTLLKNLNFTSNLWTWIFSPKQNYFLWTRTYNALLFQVHDIKTRQQHNTTCPSWEREPTWPDPCHMRAGVTSWHWDPRLLSQQAHRIFSICWESRTETEEGEHWICNGNSGGRKAPLTALPPTIYVTSTGHV